MLEYCGEVLDHKEFKARVKEYARNKNIHYYFMALKNDEVSGQPTKTLLGVSTLCAEQCSEPAVGVFLGEGHLGCLTARFLTCCSVPAWFKRGFVAWLCSRVLKIGEGKRRNCPCGSGKGWGYGPTPST